MKIYRIVGQQGRVTIPFALRQILGFRPDDVVSFELTGKDAVLVRRESLQPREIPKPMPQHKLPMINRAMEPLPPKNRKMPQAAMQMPETKDMALGDTPTLPRAPQASRPTRLAMETKEISRAASSLGMPV